MIDRYGELMERLETQRGLRGFSSFLMSVHDMRHLQFNPEFAFENVSPSPQGGCCISR
jgi:hypothetical protein